MAKKGSQRSPQKSVRRRLLGGDIQGAANQRRLFELAGRDPDDPELEPHKRLLSLGRTDLVHKLNLPLRAKAARRVMDGRVFPILHSPTEGELLLGTSTDLHEDGAEVRIPISSLLRHTLVGGMTGVGKSYQILFLVRQLLEQGVTVWVFDIENEFRVLLPLFSRDVLWWVRPESMFFNPFQVQGDVKEWKERVVMLCRQVYYLRDGSSSLLSETLSQLYQEHGSFNNSGQWPSLTDLWRKLKTMKFAANSRKSGYLESLERCVSSLRDGLPSFDCRRGMPIEEFRKRSVIFDVSSLPVHHLEFFICAMLMVATDE